jgi:AcrR family transcriptional regulator
VGETATSERTAATEGRRERVRRETLVELKQAALEEVREQGAVGLSLRSVARRMGMSPAGLYRYVASREDLLTTLIAEGYQDLGHHLEVAIGAPADRDGVPDRPAPAPPVVAGPETDVADRARAVALAYRHWSVTHPNEFGLLFGDPIPGYEAPMGGPTVAGMRRVGAGLAQPLVEAWHAGRVRDHPALSDPELRSALAPMLEFSDELPVEVFGRFMLAWGRLHGQVSLEVFGHHRWLFPDGCEPLFRADVEMMLTDLGLLDPRPGDGAG